MKTYIVNGVPSRKESLESHLKDRGILDVVWKNEFTADCTFVKWLKSHIDTKFALKTLSFYCNYYSALVDGVNDIDNEYFIVCEDDVVFCKHWRIMLSKITKEHINILGLGVNYHIDPNNKLIYTGNPGGSECTMYSRLGAKTILENIDFRHGIDIGIGCVMGFFFNLQPATTPICHQTSLLTHDTSLPPEESIDWRLSMRKYMPTSVSWDSLMVPYNEFMIKKVRVEQDFNERYGVSIDIWNSSFITSRYNHIM